jgi:hypothetical protein
MGMSVLARTIREVSPRSVVTDLPVSVCLGMAIVDGEFTMCG